MSRAMLAALTHQGLVRASNQDATVAGPLPGGDTLLAVADGVGGYAGGDVASQLAVDALREVLGRREHSNDPAAALDEAFREADRRIREQQRGALAEMSTTLVAALVRGQQAWLANVGDSRGYLHDGVGLTQVTLDHSWVEEELRAGRLQPGDPLTHAARHVITRSIGGHAPLDVDTFGPLDLAPGSALLLCSDGLHGVVPAPEIGSALRPPADDAARRLVEVALSHGGPDNIGVALIIA
jgi:PPM family protein phosphatase